MNLQVQAQTTDFFFRHLNRAGGLASNLVSPIVQDGEGFIWIATENGLQKYDGYNFTSYQRELQDLLHAKVDVVTPDGISKYVLPYIEKDMLLIYEATAKR